MVVSVLSLNEAVKSGLLRADVSLQIHFTFTAEVSVKIGDQVGRDTTVE